MSSEKLDIVDNGQLEHIDPSFLVNFRSNLIFNLFYKIFDVVHAETEEQINEAHRLRYEVFCLENEGYEDPKHHPDGLERDQYDARSEHMLLIYKPTGEAIGTCRIIKPNLNNLWESFPLQTLCQSNHLTNKDYIANSCEFSRFCLSKNRFSRIKKKIFDSTGYFAKAEQNIYFYEKPFLKIVLSMATLGIIRGAFELSLKNGILNVFGIMEPRHLARLENAGLIHEQISDPLEYHGTRVPFVCNILEIFDHAVVHHHDIWKVVSMKGLNHFHSKSIYQSKNMIN